MSTIDRSTNQSHQPHYARTSRSAKAAVAFVSVLMSSALLGGMLGLFEMQSADAAIARALIDAQPPTTWIALQRVGSASRG